MNEKQKELLKKIVDDKYSAGAFSGMCYNKYMDFKMKGLDVDIESVISEALDVRLKMEELVNGEKTSE